ANGNGCLLAMFVSVVDSQWSFSTSKIQNFDRKFAAKILNGFRHM
ncbi:unnamed protein product, partial [Heterotrigona itama]